MTERPKSESDLYKTMIKVVAAGMLLASACSAEAVVAAEPAPANPDLGGRISE